MSVNPETKQVLLQNLFYSPNTLYTSIKTLYDAVKNHGITIKEVREFVQKQEVNQLFKVPNRIKKYFPITAKHKYDIVQIDLVDMSDISSSNNGVKYLLVAVDVFSRVAFVEPMKNKAQSTIIETMEKIVEKTEPNTINCDLGSEFISQAFKTMMAKQGTDVNYVDAKEHKKLGIVDRFVRTLRRKINVYLSMHHTSKYIDVLPKIIFTYNHSYHTGIKKKPSEVEDDDDKIILLNNKKYNDAIREETVFNIGDSVRCIVNLQTFEKKGLPRWSKTVHKIILSSPHSYTLENGKTYKYYELQRADTVQKLEKPIKEPTQKQLRQENTKQRRFVRSGLDAAQVLTSKRAPQPKRKFGIE